MWCVVCGVWRVVWESFRQRFVEKFINAPENFTDTHTTHHTPHTTRHLTLVYGVVHPSESVTALHSPAACLIESQTRTPRIYSSTVLASAHAAVGSGLSPACHRTTVNIQYFHITNFYLDSATAQSTSTHPERDLQQHGAPSRALCGG